MRTKDSIPIRLVSHNIRYATKSPFKGEETWKIRRSHLTTELLYTIRHCPSALIGLQEVLDSQLDDILADLRSNNSDSWTYVGVGRDDGYRAGEYSPVLFRADTWRLLRWKTVWLSETPGTPSKGWDAASIRILTVATLQHRETGRSIVMANTHLDDQGSKARLEAAKLIQQTLRCSASEDDADVAMPTVLTGDLNSEPSQEAYMTLNSSTSLVQDVYDFVPADKRYGHENTFTGFGYEDEPLKRIDFIFIGPRKTLDKCASVGNNSNSGPGSDWTVGGYGVLESRFEDGIYNSDHRAVVADVQLR